MNATRASRRLFVVTATLACLALTVQSVEATPITYGLQLWLDATDENTFTFSPSSSTNVQQWRDKSGNLHHANAGTMMPVRVSDPDPALNPIGGQPAVLFSRSSSDSTALDVAGNFGIVANGRRTAFVVMRYSTPTVSNFILGTSLQSVVNVGYSNGQLRLRNINLIEDSAAGTVPGATDTVLSIRGEQGTAHTTIAYYNGNSIIDTGTYAFHWPIGTNLEVGGANYDSLAYQGYIAEVLLYNRALGTSEMNSVGYYLRQKYDILPLGRYGVPEPSTLLLAIVGLLLVAGRRANKKCAA